MTVSEFATYSTDQNSERHPMVACVPAGWYYDVTTGTHPNARCNTANPSGHVLGIVTYWIEYDF